MEQAPLRSRRHDDGFTLVEVIVALALVGVIATAAIMMVTRGVERSTYVQDAQTATTLANQAMERARAVSASISAGDTVTGLVQGRSQADVQGQWAAVANPAEAETQMTWDLTVASGEQVSVPLRTTSTVDKQTYVVDTLIGTCYRLRTNTTDPCSFSGAAPSATHIAMARVMVEVSWTPTGSTTCPPAGCVYRVTSLVDAQGDREWIAGAGLKALDDPSVTAKAMTEVDMDVLANDIGEVALNNAVEVVTPPAVGTIVSINATTGVIRYRAPAGGAQILDFTYRFKNTTGSWSNAGRVTVTITPAAVVAVSDSLSTVVRGVPTTVAVLTNDTWDRSAAAPTIAVTQPPSGQGSVSVVGDGTVLYTSPTTWPTAPTGTTSFTYSFTDAFGQVSGTASVSLTVRVVAPVAASFTTADVAAQAAGATSTVDIDVLARATGTTSSAIIQVVNQPVAGGGTVGTATRAGGQVFTYRPPTVLGKYSFTYRVVQDGVMSNTATVSVRVVPGLTADAPPPAPRGYTSSDPSLWRANDVSNSYGTGAGQVTLVGVTAPAGCGTVSAVNATAGTFSYLTASSARTCVLTYTVAGGQPSTNDLRSTSTVTVVTQ